MHWKDVDALTFDCYGTLVDWEAGILAVLVPLVRDHGSDVGPEDLLARFAHHEACVEAEPFRPYRAVLEEVTRRLSRDLGFEADPEEARALADSLPDWPLFPDTREALGRLASRYRLGILSNVDDDLFAATRERLGADFAWVVTASQVGSYKPAPANFAALLDRVDVPRGRLVHAAQSLFHDIAPARAAGLATVWVDRRADREGAGATPPAEATPDLRVESLRELARVAVGD